MTILAGDVGGTKTHLALYQGQKCVGQEIYPSRDYKDFLQLLQVFLSSHKQKIEKACLGIAGPVREGVSSITNLPWVIKASAISNLLNGAPVWLLNDLQAHAYGLCGLTEADYVVLNEGRESPGNRALIAAGTGLGEAGLYWDGKQHHGFATEGGHADFAPRDDLEINLFKYLQKKYGHVSYERVLSGSGFGELFHFLTETGVVEKPAWSPQVKEEDLSKAISENAEKGCAVSKRIQDWFVSLYGSEAGNLALKFLSVSGLYIAGGIAPKIIPALKDGNFMKAFKNKGRFESLLSSIPVRVVLNENTALLGSLEYANRKSDAQ